jgi:ribose-phosphate pyrophosphokinase
MMLLPMPGNEALAHALAAELSLPVATLETRHFPDGETYLRLGDEMRGRDVAILCTLADPDPQFLRLAFAARTARALGARSVILVAPYLAYLRQDRAFKLGEAVSSRHFASLLSDLFDRLITIDPHLHRIAGLEKIFPIPVTVLHCAPLLGAWVKAHVRRPLIIGPDSESAQWAAAVAEQAQAPHVVLTKRRLGDREVIIEAPDLAAWQDHVPVLIDDIIASGHTMAAAAVQVQARGLARPVCLGVHALFAGDAYARLLAVSAAVVTTDTIPHPSNLIAIAPLIATALHRPDTGTTADAKGRAGRVSAAAPVRQRERA